MLICADAKIPRVESSFSQFGQVRLFDSRELQPAFVRDADILLVRSETKVGHELLTGSRVRFVASATAGIDHVDTAYLAEQGIVFASAPGANSRSVAEYVLAALLEIAHRQNISLQSKCIGVVGVGAVGSKVVRICQALGMRVLQNDPPQERLSGGAQFRPFEELYQADLLTLHVPLTFTGADATCHLIDETCLRQLSPSCILLNTSRGGVVDGSSLKQALKEHRLRAAILDVWENEPKVDPELIQMSEIATPHIAGYSYDGKVRATAMIHAAACNFLGVSAEISSDMEPARAVPALQAQARHNLQQLLRELVRNFYDIESDDHSLRTAAAQPASLASRFAELRQKYGVRREFSTTEIALPPPLSHLAPTLRALGFRQRSAN